MGKNLILAEKKTKLFRLLTWSEQLKFKPEKADRLLKLLSTWSSHGILWALSLFSTSENLDIDVDC